MLDIRKLMVIRGLLITILLATGAQVCAQGLPNPYRTVPGWAKFSDGRQMGAVGDVAIDPDGKARAFWRSRVS